jgi:hypothetical protein
MRKLSDVQSVIGGANMVVTSRKEISKEVYDRAVANNGRMTEDDEIAILGAYVYGYGLYGTAVYQEDGKYMVSFRHGDSCE